MQEITPRSPLLILALALLSLSLSCQSGGSASADAGAVDPERFDASSIEEEPDAAPVPVSTCSEEFLGAGDGCDCGCGVVDPDCPSPASAADCQYDNCGAEAELDPSDPSQCLPIAVPAGWTCSASLYGADGVCSCGCGALDDKNCPSTLTLADCYYAQNGCPSGSSPSPDDPTSCQPTPAGWTCNWQSYYDNDCDCGCGIVDPACPADAHISQCDGDECASGYSPDPTDLTTCIDDAPQDGWTCDLAMLLDGSCDCGCGTPDPDCAGSTNPASCSTLNCAVGDELKPGSLSQCWETCIPLDETVGNATCTNGGFISIFNSCNTNLSACTDGRSYEVECVGSECTCRVNGNCVAHEVGSCSLNFTCGWSLTDNT